VQVSLWDRAVAPSALRVFVDGRGGCWVAPFEGVEAALDREPRHQAGLRRAADRRRALGGRASWSHPAQATVPRQYGQVFACRWDGVQRIGVTRDRKAIKTSIRHATHGIRRTPLGNLAVPFMRAAVVIYVDREQSTLPDIKPARGLLSANWSSPGFHQPLWVVPTRHPAELEAALAALPLPPGTVGDPFPDSADQPSITDWFVT